MNVMQFLESMQSLLAAHKEGLISNDNLTQATLEVGTAYEAQHEDFKTGDDSCPRIVFTPEEPATEAKREVAIKRAMKALGVKRTEAAERIDWYVEKLRQSCAVNGFGSDRFLVGTQQSKKSFFVTNDYSIIEINW